MSFFIKTAIWQLDIGLDKLITRSRKIIESKELKFNSSIYIQSTTVE